MHYPKALFILVICLFFQGCSYSYNLVVVNESDAPIEVNYMIGGDENDGSFPAHYIPQVMSEKRWNEEFKESDWKAVEASEYSVDTETRRFKTQVAARSVLRIMQIGDHALRSEAEFRVKHVDLRGNYGRIVLQGGQLKTQFVKDAKHSIRYHQALKD